MLNKKLENQEENGDGAGKRIDTKEVARWRQDNEGGGTQDSKGEKHHTRRHG